MGSMRTDRRRSEEEICIWGNHPVEEFLRVRPDAVLGVYILPSFGRTRPQRDLERLIEEIGVAIHRVQDFSRLPVPPGTVHQGVAALVKPVWEVDFGDLLDSMASGTALYVICDQVTDPHNFGAILRSAVAFGVSAVIVSERDTSPVTGVTVKASSGAVAHARICRVPNLAAAMASCREQGISLVGLAPGGNTPVWDADLTGPSAVVLGAEGKGLRRRVEATCDCLVRIPHGPSVESLNVSTAAGIVLYEVARQRGLSARRGVSA